MKIYFSAGTVIFTQANGTREYLVLHYKAGHWDFPKGKIEPGESQQQAALRELQEETGLTNATIIPGFQESFSYSYTEYNGHRAKKTVLFFVAEVFEQKITLSREHIGYLWLPLPQALQQVTFENARMVLKKADEFMVHAH